MGREIHVPGSAVRRHLPNNRLVELRFPSKDGRWQVRTFDIELLCAKVNDASTVRAEAVDFTFIKTKTFQALGAGREREAAELAVEPASP